MEVGKIQRSKNVLWNLKSEKNSKVKNMCQKSRYWNLKKYYEMKVGSRIGSWKNSGVKKIFYEIWKSESW